FSQNNDFEYRLLSDVEGALCQAYGVCDTGYAQRVTFVVGDDGAIKHVVADIDADKHPSAVLEFLNQ
ncbi:MAG: redoxin domain-containing protein, partial [Chloroflexota bacterium]